ncbi:MAG: M56 family metallopeptidase [Caldilineales bacterium]|nr:M56 family metallopeptidase [Caldilineales bacterium]MDW8316644.1 M56 family metallopeptidase [Anaerolineae bacterium]
MRLRASAAQAFWGLVVVAVGAVVGLATLVAWQAPVLAAGVWQACADAAVAVAGLLPALGLVLPTALLAGGVAAALGVAILQLYHTRRLERWVRARRVPWPAPLAEALADFEPDQRTLLVDDLAPYTFTLGLRRPHVWVSAGLVEALDPAELQAVLRHERHHLWRRDPLRVFVSRCLARLAFFVPMAPALRDAYLVAKEVEADAASGADDALAAALLKLLRSGPRLPVPAHLAAIGPVDATAARIQRLAAGQGRLQPTGVRRPRILTSLAVALALVAVSYFSTARTAGPLADNECGYSAAPARAAVWQTPASWQTASLAGRP